MDFYNNEKITRKKFLKGVAGAAVCCACFSLDCSADSKENSKDKIKDGNGKVHLAAACGTYCGACPAYIATHSEDEQISMRLQKRSSSESTNSLKGIPLRIPGGGFFATAVLAAAGLPPIAKAAI